MHLSRDPNIRIGQSHSLVSNSSAKKLYIYRKNKVEFTYLKILAAIRRLVKAASFHRYFKCFHLVWFLIYLVHNEQKALYPCCFCIGQRRWAAPSRSLLSGSYRFPNSIPRPAGPESVSVSAALCSAGSSRK